MFYVEHGIFFTKHLYFAPFTLFLGCYSKNSYSIKRDPVLLDLQEQVSVLEEDLKKLRHEVEQVEVAIKDPEYDSEMRDSMRKELFEADKYDRMIDERVSYLKVRYKKRKKSLEERHSMGKELIPIAEKEVKDYFIHKKLHPSDTPWKNRYRSALELR